MSASDGVLMGPYSFTRGQIIYFDEPFSVVLSTDCLETYCSCCFAKLRGSALVVPCLQCGKLSYCSSDCQIKDADFHSLECELLQKHEGPVSTVHRLTTRALNRALAEQNTGNYTVHYFFDHYRTINEVESHFGVVQGKKLFEMRDEALELVDKLENAEIEIPCEIVLEMLLKVRMSSHIIYESHAPMMKRLGRGIYIGASRMGHTCNHITDYVVSFNGPNLVVTAIKDFTVKSALQLRWPYVLPNLPVRQRRAKLKRDYLVDCDCTRCLLEMASDHPDVAEHLRFFAELTPGTAWSHQAMKYHKLLVRFPERFYYNFLLCWKLQRSLSKREECKDAIRYGTLALRGCMTFEHRKQIYWLLLHDMEKLEYNNPRNPGFEDFIRLRAEAVNLLSVVFESRHHIVKTIRILKYYELKKPNPDYPVGKGVIPVS